MDIFGIRIRHLRKMRNLTQEDLGKKIGVTKTSISGYENGSRSPDREMLGKLADALETNIDYLMGRSDNYELNENQNKLWDDLETMSIEEIMERYNIVWEGKAISKEEMMEMLIYLKTKRLMGR